MCMRRRKKSRTKQTKKIVSCSSKKEVSALSDSRAGTPGFAHAGAEKKTKFFFALTREKQKKTPKSTKNTPQKQQKHQKTQKKHQKKPLASKKKPISHPGQNGMKPKKFPLCARRAKVGQGPGPRRGQTRGQTRGSGPASAGPRCLLPEKRVADYRCRLTAPLASVRTCQLVHSNTFFGSLAQPTYRARSPVPFADAPLTIAAPSCCERRRCRGPSASRAA